MNSNFSTGSNSNPNNLINALLSDCKNANNINNNGNSSNSKHSNDERIFFQQLLAISNNNNNNNNIAFAKQKRSNISNYSYGNIRGNGILPSAPVLNNVISSNTSNDTNDTAIISNDAAKVKTSIDINDCSTNNLFNAFTNKMNNNNINLGNNNNNNLSQFRFMPYNTNYNLNSMSNIPNVGNITCTNVSSLGNLLNLSQIGGVNASKLVLNNDGTVGFVPTLGSFGSNLINTNNNNNIISNNNNNNNNNNSNLNLDLASLGSFVSALKNEEKNGIKQEK